jgi:hypothetical protein
MTLDKNTTALNQNEIDRRQQINQTVNKAINAT